MNSLACFVVLVPNGGQLKRCSVPNMSFTRSKKNILEIEGYEKNEWIKFDCYNEKSFPKHSDSVIIAWWNELDKRFNVLPAVFFEDRFKYYASFNDIPHSKTIYWRLFPMLPKEIGKSI